MSPALSSGLRAAFCGLLAVVVLLLPGETRASLSESRVEKLQVEIDIAGEGLLSELRRNVETYLSIAQEDPKDDGTSVSRLRRLHAGAEEEIRDALEPFGYYEPTVRSRLGGEAGSWRAEYDIEPGRRMLVEAVDLDVAGEGSSEPAIVEAQEGFPLRAGSPLSHADYEAGKAQLIDAASAGGYLRADFATAELRIDLERYVASVYLRFDTGPQYRFGRTIFDQEVLDEDMLAGYVQHARGAPLDLHELLKLQNALSDSPYFQSVEVDADLDAAEDLEVPIVVRLVPSAAQRWDLGAGYGTDTGVRGNIEFEQRRVNRRGHRAEVEATISEIEQSSGVRYLIPGAYPRTDVLTLSAGFSEKRPDTSISETALVGVGRTQSRGAWREALGLHFERTDFAVGVDSGISELLVAEANWSRVRADDRLFPRRGQRLELGARGAEESLLSDTSFLQARVEGKAVRSFGGWARAMGRVEVGHIWTDGFRQLPPAKRYFAGGDQSVRGYGYEELGRLDEQGNVIGGEAVLTASLEIDSLFLDLGKAGRWGAAIFYDVGGAGAELGDLLVSGAGVGLRWLSPIGIVRADAAWALDLEGTPLRFHLMIGPDL